MIYREKLPEELVAKCCAGCNAYPVRIYLVPDAGFRYRCATCLDKEKAGISTPERKERSGELTPFRLRCRRRCSL